ncbi:hypothetical protein L0Z16_23025 [Burkholderia multivorans]|uniref:hypothetical protein n=1 Tax=Burkholderia multivorans TaxID=87883 RepID=UPI0020196A58|nr:hypothetical protein [Burkholderia multivorans]MCL4662076.1 hypothetical protein [Burkholderia multivorans]MCO1353509.1 hypothetical protein [Burkholderia multivorans]MCO1412647.1 hypothetical protein [Burkholderia multivorans]MCO1447162.1 hypothetical protein [Burkholderia multivorans]UQP47308.1 hypothetical protein L0Z16_23025 [Burkholderia multivorans]
MESENKVRKPTGKRYSDEVRERAVRMVFEHQHEYETQGAAIRSIAYSGERDHAFRRIVIMDSE